MTMDLIDRKAAIEEFEDMVTSVSVYGESAEARYATNARIRFIEKLNSIPTVDAEPVQHGRWVRHYSRPNVYADLLWYCSVCSKPCGYSHAYMLVRCPECGAKMDLKEDDDAETNL